MSPIFEFPFSRYISPFFRRFDLFSKSNIPISTAVHTTSAFHHTQTFSIFFRNFFKIFRALFVGPWGSCLLFSNSPSPATYPHIFFRRFDLFSQSQIYCNDHGCVSKPKSLFVTTTGMLLQFPATNPSLVLYRPAMLRQWHGLSPLVLGGRLVHTPDDSW